VTASLQQARAAFAARAWRVAVDLYAAAAASAPLLADDHGRRAAAAFLVGDDVTCERAWEDAYRSADEAGEACTAPARAKDTMERQVVTSWQPFIVDEAMSISQPMVIASGRTPIRSPTTA
jgi:hypothetical protein